MNEAGQPQGVDLELSFCGKNASFWLRNSSELPKLKQGIEQVLSDFSYYPQMEWDVIGFRPPEGCPFFGAWRTKSSTEFVYLVGGSDLNSRVGR